MRKSSMLQRQLKLNAFYVQEMEQLIEDVKGDYASVRKVRNRIRQLAELQVFLKKELQHAHVVESMSEAGCTSKTLLYWPEPLQPYYGHDMIFAKGGPSFPRDPNSGGPRWSPELAAEGKYKHSHSS